MHIPTVHCMCVNMYIYVYSCTYMYMYTCSIEFPHATNNNFERFSIMCIS